MGMHRFFAVLIAASLILSMHAGAVSRVKDSSSAVPLFTVTIPASDPADHVISHRGASGDAREHSFDAYDLAIEYGSHHLELDIVVSRNGTLYVSHDTSANRLFGVNKEFHLLTDKQIDALRTSDGYPVLRLDSVFERYGSSIIYFIELKRPVETADKLIRLIKQHGLQENIFIQCSRSDTIQEMKKAIPSLRFIVSVHNDNELRNALSHSYVDVVIVHSSLMSMRYCFMTHEYGKKLAVWTLNSRDEIVHAILIGVDYIYTNYTALALELESEYRGLTRTERTEKYK